MATTSKVWIGSLKENHLKKEKIIMLPDRLEGAITFIEGGGDYFFLTGRRLNQNSDALYFGKMDSDKLIPINIANSINQIVFLPKNEHQLAICDGSKKIHLLSVRKLSHEMVEEKIPLQEYKEKKTEYWLSSLPGQKQNIRFLVKHGLLRHWVNKNGSLQKERKIIKPAR